MPTKAQEQKAIEQRTNRARKQALKPAPEQPEDGATAVKLEVVRKQPRTAKLPGRMSAR